MLNFLVFFSLIGNGLFTNSVFIHQESSVSKEFTITCTISGLNSDKFSPHLYCPLTKSRMCYTNCTKECKFSNGECRTLSGLEAIVDCKYTFYSHDHIKIEYYINSDIVPNDKGEWFCSYAGVNSKVITLNLMEKKLMTSKKIVLSRMTTKTVQLKSKENLKNNPYTVEVIRVYRITDTVHVPRVTSKIQEVKQDSQSDADDISFRTFITKFQIVIGLLCLFVLSIILNIIFCIRDSLIKCYIDNIKNNVSSHRALLFCVCQRNSISTPKFDSMLSREAIYYKDNHNLTGNNVYDYDSQIPLVAQQHSYNGDVRPSPHILRSQSFQHASPIFLNRKNDPWCMPISQGHIQQSPYNCRVHANTHFDHPGSVSLAGSDTPREDIIREGRYQVDSQGNAILMNFIPSTLSTNPQSVDLINDCDQTNMTQSSSNFSKKEG